MSKKSNVHPDYYKTAGRDRQDDAAAARQARSVAAKASSRERPDRMSKGPYFQRAETTPEGPSGERNAGAKKTPPTRPSRAMPKKSSLQGRGSRSKTKQDPPRFGSKKKKKR
jgi:hypothetical protein